jgi:hypothetical protein
VRTAQAYYNWGRFVCDCPEPGCKDARLVYEVDPRTGIPTGRKLTEDVCAAGHPFRIEMPPPEIEAQIVAALAAREDRDKAWYPRGHPLGVAAGQPTGQSVADLHTENREVTKARTTQRDAERDRLREVLAELGVNVRDDGTFEGSL